MPIYSVDHASLLISAVATLVAACAGLISYAVYRSQSDPDVVIFAEADELRPSIINLVIKNMGRGPAYDVRFRLSSQLPSSAFGLNIEDRKDYEVMGDGPLVTGIPFLPPGSKRVITWGQLGGLYGILGDNAVVITSIYKSRHFGIPRKIANKQSSVVEIFSFKGTDASRKNYEAQIADGIKELSKSVSQIARNMT